MTYFYRAGGGGHGPLGPPTGSATADSLKYCLLTCFPRFSAKIQYVYIQKYMFYVALCVNTLKKHDRSSQFDVVREENNTLVIVGTSCSPS